MSDPSATVVLVHGAWHGAWCWERIVDRLSASGVPAVAVDLPGHGRDPGPLSDLHGDSARVRTVLDTIDGPVVLVGHSYGGAVITEAGVHQAVTHLVYLCALALDGDETCVSAASAEVTAAGISYALRSTADVSEQALGRPDLGAGFISHGEGTVILDRTVAAACLYNNCDLETANWALDRLGAQPLITFQQAPHAVAWRTKPSTYIVCANDLSLHPDFQRILAKRCTSVIECDSDHSPFLSQPDQLASTLRALALPSATD